MNNTKTDKTTQEFAKEFFLLLLDTYKYLQEQKKKEQDLKNIYSDETKTKGGEQI